MLGPQSSALQLRKKQRFKRLKRGWKDISEGIERAQDFQGEFSRKTGAQKYPFASIDTSRLAHPQDSTLPLFPTHSRAAEGLSIALHIGQGE